MIYYNILLNFSTWKLIWAWILKSEIQVSKHFTFICTCCYRAKISEHQFNLKMLLKTCFREIWIVKSWCFNIQTVLDTMVITKHHNSWRIWIDLKKTKSWKKSILFWTFISFNNFFIPRPKPYNINVTESKLNYFSHGEWYTGINKMVQMILKVYFTLCNILFCTHRITQILHTIENLFYTRTQNVAANIWQRCSSAISGFLWYKQIKESWDTITKQVDYDDEKKDQSYSVSMKSANSIGEVFIFFDCQNV